VVGAVKLLENARGHGENGPKRQRGATTRKVRKRRGATLNRGLRNKVAKQCLFLYSSHTLVPHSHFEFYRLHVLNVGVVLDAVAAHVVHVVAPLPPAHPNPRGQVAHHQAPEIVYFPLVGLSAREKKTRERKESKRNKRGNGRVTETEKYTEMVRARTTGHETSFRKEITDSRNLSQRFTTALWPMSCPTNAICCQNSARSAAPPMCAAKDPQAKVQYTAPRNRLASQV